MCEQYSLAHLLSKYADFKEQKTDIEQMCQELTSKYNYSVNIIFTPKFHCIRGALVKEFTEESQFTRKGRVVSSNDWDTHVYHT